MNFLLAALLCLSVGLSSALIRRGPNPNMPDQQQTSPQGPQPIIVQPNQPDPNKQQTVPTPGQGNPPQQPSGPNMSNPPQQGSQPQQRAEHNMGNPPKQGGQQQGGQRPGPNMGGQQMQNQGGQRPGPNMGGQQMQNQGGQRPGPNMGGQQMQNQGGQSQPNQPNSPQDVGQPNSQQQGEFRRENGGNGNRGHNCQGRNCNQGGNGGRNCNGRDCNGGGNCNGRDCNGGGNCNGRDCGGSNSGQGGNNQCGRFEHPMRNSRGETRCVTRPGSCSNTQFFHHHECFSSPCQNFEHRCRQAHFCFSDACDPCEPRYYDSDWNEVCRHS